MGSCISKSIETPNIMWYDNYIIDEKQVSELIAQIQEEVELEQYIRVLTLPTCKKIIHVV
jgi:glutamine phosphoribosylpyrophosphate amidotransferase